MGLHEAENSTERNIIIQESNRKETLHYDADCKARNKTEPKLNLLI